MSQAPAKSERPVAADPSVIRAVAQQLKEHEAAEKEKEFLADQAERGNLTGPALFRYIGKASRELGRELARWATVFSRVKAPRTTDADYLNPGGVLALNIGDRDPVKAYGPEFYVRLEGDEAAEAVSVQSALALREAEIPLANAAGVYQAAGIDLKKKNDAVTAATAARDTAEGVLAEAEKRHEAAKATFQAAVEKLGDEAAVRAVLAGMVKPPVPYEAPRAHFPAGHDQVQRA